MLELLLFIAVIIIVVVAIKLGKQDNAPAARPSGLPDGLKMARQRAVESGDTEAVQAIDNGTYKDLLEKRAAARESKIAPGIEIYQYSIAGINFRRGIAAYVGNSVGCLKPQPHNQYDTNAIAVYSTDGHHIGFIPADETDDVRALRLRFPIPVAVYIEECYDDTEDRTYFVGTVTIQVQKKPAK